MTTILVFFWLDGASDNATPAEVAYPATMLMARHVRSNRRRGR